MRRRGPRAPAPPAMPVPPHHPTPEASQGAWLAREDRAPAVALFFLSLALYAGAALRVAAETGLPLGSLGAFFDGFLYLEIAKSFPLPYAPEGRDYLGQAPGYPALIALARAVTPAAWAHWGALALLASWIPAALAAVAFFALCRALGIAPWWPSVAFAAANPRWISVSATAHPESLAMLLVLLAALACRRGRLGVSVLWLALAGLTRFPALLVGAALAWATLIERRDLRPRSLALLAVPLLAFGLLNLYLAVRIPGFAGMAEAHRVFLDAHPTWPFAALIENAVHAVRGEAPLPNAALTYGSVVVYLLAIAVGLRDRALRGLGVWVAAVVLAHACIGGAWVGFDFPRLVVLAWPAALLILWRRFAAPLAPQLRAVACAAAAVLSLGVATDLVSSAVRWQGASYPWPAHAVRGFHTDEPRWIDFRGRFSPAPRARPDAGRRAP